MSRPLIGYRPGVMALRPPRPRSAPPPAREVDYGYASDARAYAAARIDWAAYQDALAQPEWLRKQTEDSAAMQKAAVHGEPTPWPSRSFLPAEYAWMTEDATPAWRGPVVGIALLLICAAGVHFLFQNWGH